MITGYFDSAAGGKSRATQVPLSALMFAAVWLDIVSVPLFVLGTEIIAATPTAHVGDGAP